MTVVTHHVTDFEAADRLPMTTRRAIRRIRASSPGRG
jgi:hypothetical protein